MKTTFKKILGVLSTILGFVLLLLSCLFGVNQYYKTKKDDKDLEKIRKQKADEEKKYEETKRANADAINSMSIDDVDAFIRSKLKR